MCDLYNLNHRDNGFTLVELSIVLVIIGLLVGGILTGQSLIRAAELRSVATQYTNYNAAFHTFRDKYFALPGDITNATSYWGTQDPTPATCANTASSSALTCNGDGDGQIVDVVSNSREQYRAWQHLKNAGLIEGQYNGINNPTSWGFGSTPGVNVPRAKIGNAGFSIINTEWAAARTTGIYPNIFYPSGNAHFLMFGTNQANSYTSTPILKSTEAYNIDMKLDDGMPGLGRITTFNNTTGVNCASSDTASSAIYQLSNTSANACTLMMGLGL